MDKVISSATMAAAPVLQDLSKTLVVFGLWGIPMATMVSWTHDARSRPAPLAQDR
jgi:hypothetical protein